jgi:hypothetical protein
MKLDRSFLAQLQGSARSNYLGLVEVEGSGPGDERYETDTFKPGVAVVGESESQALAWTYDVFPSSVVDETEKLHQSAGGLVELGIWFLPKLVPDESYDITIEWDFRGASPSTRGVCSFGEETSKFSGPMEALLGSVCQ